MPSPRGSATSTQTANRTATLAGPRRLALAAATGGLMALACVGTVVVVLSGTSTGPPLRPPPLPGQGSLAPGPGVVLPSSPPRSGTVRALPGPGPLAVPALLRPAPMQAPAVAASPPVRHRPAAKPASRAPSERKARAALTRAAGPSPPAETSSTRRRQDRADERGSKEDRDEHSPGAKAAAKRSTSPP